MKILFLFKLVNNKKWFGSKIYIKKIPFLTLYTLPPSGRKGMRTKQVAEEQNKVKKLLNMSCIPPKVKAATMEVFLPTNMRARQASKVDRVLRQLEIIQRVCRSYCWKGLEQGGIYSCCLCFQLYLLVLMIRPYKTMAFAIHRKNLNKLGKIIAQASRTNMVYWLLYIADL